MDKIDLVYCWCDGSDPVWKKRRQARMAELGMTYEPESEENGDKRYEQLDELRYSLRSAEVYVPWINHIYIITDNQKPSWLKEHPKISIIDHKQIIPEKLLPTFSSVTIEMYLDRIPGLSEHFIYGNDDFFFNKPLKPEDFYKKGKPVVWFERYTMFPEKLSKSQGEQLLAGECAYPWGRTILNAWLLFLEKNGATEKEMPFLGPLHSFDAYTKTIFSEVKQKYPEMLENNSKPFRNEKDIMRVLIQYESVHTYGSEMHINPLRTKALRLLSRFWKPDMFNIYANTVARLARQLELFAPRAFCLNNIPTEEQEEMTLFLEKKFSIKRAWEKTV